MIQGFEEVCMHIIATHKAKNSDYGSTWNLYESMLGVKPSVGLMTRIIDKVSRACNLMRIGEENRQVEDEKLADTIMDLAVYAIITYCQLQQEADDKALIESPSLTLDVNQNPLDLYEQGLKQHDHYGLVRLADDME